MDDSTLSEAVRPVGESLVEFSRNARTSARGLITALFPYILPASKRMSTRAISAYLEQAHQVSISAATIAKALREPEKHIESLADAIEPDARIVADALEVDLGELLANEDLFSGTADKPPVLGGGSELETRDEYDKYVNARYHLEQSWYPLDGAVRSMVIAVIEGREEDVE